MKTHLFTAAALLFLGTGASLSASTICPSTPSTSTDCDFLITIGTTGMASVTEVAGSTPFNSPYTSVDGNPIAGGNGSLIGVIDDYSRSLTSLTLKGSGANAGIFDFSFNGICCYTNAGYCSTAASGYEGPTTTFSNLQSTVPFQTNVGVVNFGPALLSGQSTYFSLQNSASDIGSNGGLSVLTETFGPSTATPEPSEMALLGLGVALIAVGRKKWAARRPH